MNNNSKLHQLLGDERILNKQLQMKVAHLELELDVLKKERRRTLDPPVIIDEPTTNANTQPTYGSVERNLVEQKSGKELN